ncbi:unnamed protein product, partial [Phaeothamnion confervicola]
ADFDSFNATKIVRPFLLVVQSVETNGPLTDAALSSLLALLRLNVIVPGMPEAREAMSELVAGVTHARFEETSRPHDEAVRMRIMEVLTAALAGPAGRWLGDDAVWEALHTCFVMNNEVRA